MAKYRFYQVVMAGAIMVLILTTAVVCAFAMTNISADRYMEDYKNYRGEEDEITAVDAFVEYDLLVSDLGKLDSNFAEGNLYINDYNRQRLGQLRQIYTICKALIPLSIIILFFAFIGVRKRRLYDGVIWGGLAATFVGTASFVMVMFSNIGFFKGLRTIVMERDYTVFFSAKDNLIWIIPRMLGGRMISVYGGIILLGLLITGVIRYITYRQSKPHKF